MSRIYGSTMSAMFPVHSLPDGSAYQNKLWAERTPYILLLDFLFFRPLQMTNKHETNLDRVGKRKRQRKREKGGGATGTSICSDLPVCWRLNNCTSTSSPVYSPTNAYYFNNKCPFTGALLASHSLSTLSNLSAFF